MATSTHIPLSIFKEVSLGDKAKAIQMFGTLLISTKAFDLDFFLYSMDDYFVEMTSLPETGDVIYIRATENVEIADMYLDAIALPEF
jgi:hypothetical protein